MRRDPARAVARRASARGTPASSTSAGRCRSPRVVGRVRAARAHAPAAAWLPIAVVVIAWSTRLGCYLVARGAATGPEEGRYVELRRRWALRATAPVLRVLPGAGRARPRSSSTAFVVPFVAAPWDSGVVRALGVADRGDRHRRRGARRRAARAVASATRRTRARSATSACGATRGTPTTSSSGACGSAMRCTGSRSRRGA